MTIMVAGVGNIFFGDDGFGPAVARRLLADDRLPEGVEVLDAGIRGMHLAYQLLEGYTALVLVDVTRRDGPPGTLYLLEHDLAVAGADAAFDPHGMEPDAVLDLLAALARGVEAGSPVERVLVLGCEPSELAPGMELSAPVTAAVEEAVGAVHRVVGQLLEERPFTEVGEPR